MPYSLNRTIRSRTAYTLNVLLFQHPVRTQLRLRLGPFRFGNCETGLFNLESHGRISCSARDMMKSFLEILFFRCLSLRRPRIACDYIASTALAHIVSTNAIFSGTAIVLTILSHSPGTATTVTWLCLPKHTMTQENQIQMYFRYLIGPWTEWRETRHWKYATTAVPYTQ